MTWRENLIDLHIGDRELTEFATEWIAGEAFAASELAMLMAEFTDEIIDFEELQNTVAHLRGELEQERQKVRFFASIVNRTADALRPVLDYQDRDRAARPRGDSRG